VIVTDVATAQTAGIEAFATLFQVALVATENCDVWIYVSTLGTLDGFALSKLSFLVCHLPCLLHVPSRLDARVMTIACILGESRPFYVYSVGRYLVMKLGISSQGPIILL
jgi:hypothetical protein